MFSGNKDIGTFPSNLIVSDREEGRRIGLGASSNGQSSVIGSIALYANTA
jgi:hypothetical protein